jgi:putative Mg2+ transporter-C (MgtC) family protein
MDSLTITETAMRIGAALCLGGLVGLERERKHRPAGFRTMILISMGSAGILITGLEAIAEMSRLTGPSNSNAVAGLGVAEISRILQGLIGGIGFLGAGAVIQNKKAVRGITTAAAVWVTSCIGAACGLGMYTLAGVISAFTLFTLVVLEHVEERYFPEPDSEENNEKERKNGNGKRAKAPPPENFAEVGVGVERLTGGWSEDR